MIIDLDERWFLDCDATSVALTERRVITGENTRGLAPKPENIGKTREVQHGFFGRIADAAQAYLNKGVASMPGAMNATQIIADWADMTAKVEKACSTIPKRGVEKSDKQEYAVIGHKGKTAGSFGPLVGDGKGGIVDLSEKTTGVEQTPVTSPAVPSFTLPQASL